MDNFTFCQVQHLISILGTVSPRKNDQNKYSFFINEVYYIVSKVYTVQGSKTSDYGIRIIFTKDSEISLYNMGHIGWEIIQRFDMK